jgi:hypothetical protein
MPAVFDLAKESLEDGFNSGNSAVGATEKALAPSYPVRKHVVIHADADNSDPILIGPRHGSASGFVLAPGETVNIPIDDLAKVFVTGASSNPAYSWMST